MASANEESHFRSDCRNRNAKLRLAEVAARQFGRVRYDQVRATGVGKATVNRWREDGYLHPELPRVYAVGHPGRTPESDLAAAVLYAGPGAMLCAATAVWWYELLKYPPSQIFVATPRRVRDHGKIVVRRERSVPRTRHRGLPVTSPSQAILDFAAAGAGKLLRLVLANADYLGLLDLQALQALRGRGIAGSTALRDAIAIHLPELARARSDLEILLLEFCERHRIPIPQMNVHVHGWLVDAHWPDARLIVEVDGVGGHRSRAQIERDHQRDLELRAAGFIVLRYTQRQLIETPDAVAADIRRWL
jgi:hypothetical protein